MKRVLVFTGTALLLLCIACVGFGYFVMIPRVEEGIRTGVDEAVSTYIVPEIAGIGIAPKAGTYTLNQNQVNNAIQTGGANLQDLQFDISPAGLELHFGEQGQILAYTAQVSAVDGKLQVDVANLSGIPTWIVPTDAISDGLENGINTYLQENNLRLASVIMQDGSMTLVLDDA